MAAASQVSVKYPGAECTRIHGSWYQMDFQRQACDPPERLDNGYPHRNVRYEVSVHNIDVDAIRPGLLRLAHVLAQVGEVGGENGRRKFYCLLVHIPSLP